MSESLYEKNFYDQDGKEGIERDGSIGVITRLEQIDQDYGRKFLRKDRWDDNVAEDGNNFQDKYEFQDESFSPDKGKYYDNLSNYQK